MSSLAAIVSTTDSISAAQFVGPACVINIEADPAGPVRAIALVSA